MTDTTPSGNILTDSASDWNSHPTNVADKLDDPNLTEVLTPEHARYRHTAKQANTIAKALADLNALLSGAATGGRPGTYLQLHGGIQVSQGPTIDAVTGDPEGQVIASPGSLRVRTDGLSGEVLYVKESGMGSEGWAVLPRAREYPEDFIRAGYGNPEGQIVGEPGMMFLRRDGIAGLGFYIKENGTGNTGWIPYAPPPRFETVVMSHGYPRYNNIAAFIPFCGTELENDNGTGPTNDRYGSTRMIAPENGYLHKVMVAKQINVSTGYVQVGFGINGASSFKQLVHVSTATSGWYEAVFNPQIAYFSKGQFLHVRINPQETTNYINITTVWKYSNDVNWAPGDPV